MTLRMLFVCMFVLGLTGVYETIIWNKRPDHATFSLAKSMTFPIFGNADTQSANHKKINFYPHLRTMQLWSNRNCCLQFPNSFPEREFFSALQLELTLVGWITL